MLTKGTVRLWTRTVAGLVLPRVVASGLTGALQGWSPGPGTFYTTSNGEEDEGIVKSYTGSPITPLPPVNTLLNKGSDPVASADSLRGAAVPPPWGSQSTYLVTDRLSHPPEPVRPTT
ncbi:hypothetical protein ACIQRK_01200 [Streptomyces anulatus]